MAGFPEEVILPQEMHDREGKQARWKAFPSRRISSKEE